MSRLKPRPTNTIYEMACIYGKGGLLPGVDLDNTSALLDLMDGIDDLKRRYGAGEGAQAQSGKPPEIPK